MKKRLLFVLVAALCIACLAGCEKNKDNGEGLTKAKDYVYAMYKDNKTQTASDYERVSFVTIDGVKYEVTWTSDAGDNVKITAGEKTTAFDVNEKTPTEVTYVLTATVKDAKSGKTMDVKFPACTIPAYQEFTYAQYVEACKNATTDNPITVTVQGVVTCIISKTKGASSNCLYLQDKDGAYYAYALDSDPITDGIEIGMTVSVTGPASLYSGCTYEINGCKATIVSKEKTPVAPIDLTDKYLSAKNNTDAVICDYQSMLVTLKGIEIKDLGDNGYHNFKLGEVPSYVRISGSTCPLTKDEQTTFTSEFSAHGGYIADVTGIVTLYSGIFYLTPVDSSCLNYISLPTRTDAEMIDTELEALKITESYTAAATVELPAAGTSYTDVKFAWASDNEEVAAIADGKLNIVLPKQDTTVKLTLTATCGAETKTKEFTLKVIAPADDMCEAEVLDKAFALGAGEALNGTQVLRGKITEIVTAYSADYKNITVNIQVGDKIIQAFRLNGGEDLKVDDEITVWGTIKNYVKNDVSTIEFDAKCEYSKELTVEEAKQLIVVAKAYELGENEAMNGTQVLRGKITKINTAYSADYKNITVTILVGDKEIQCFRLNGGEDLKEGDEITVWGKIKNYVKDGNSTIEFDSKCNYSKELTVEEVKDILVVEKAYELGENEVMNGIQEVKGTITAINTAYSAEYKNITVTIKVGEKEIQCFRLVGGEDLKEGDVITVTGKIKNYVKDGNSTIEFDSKCTYVK